MTKPFNIHDWQAKQRQQRLTEAGMDTPGGNPRYFYDDDSIIGKLKKDPDYIKKLNAKNAKKDVSENIDDDVERKINNFIKNMADDLGIPLQHVVYNIIRVIKSQNYDGVNEHHGDDFPKDLLDKKVSSFLDDLKKKTKEGPDYEAVEDIMKKHFNIDETNSLGSSGGGTIFTSGNGMAHLGKKKKNK